MTPRALPAVENWKVTLLFLFVAHKSRGCSHPPTCVSTRGTVCARLAATTFRWPNPIRPLSLGAGKRPIPSLFAGR